MNRAAIFVILAVVLPVICNADVVYTFTGVGASFAGHPAETVAFQLTVPDFVSPPMNGPNVSFSCNQFDTSSHCGDRVYFSNQSVLGSFSAQLQFNASNNVGYDFFFPSGAFITPGIYIAGGNNPNTGTLTVATTVAEPSTISLGVAGMAGVLGYIVRKRRRGL